MHIYLRLHVLASVLRAFVRCQEVPLEGRTSRHE